MIRSLWTLRDVDLGFNPDNVQTMRLSLPAARYRTDNQRLAFFSGLKERVGSLPGVETVGLANSIPLEGTDYTTQFSLQAKRDQPVEGHSLSAKYRIVDQGFFRVMGIRLIRGRSFAELDGPHSQRVAIVNEAFAAMHFHGEEPTGQRLLVESGEEVIGVVGNVRHGSPSMPVEPAIYVPYSQNAGAYPMYLLIHSQEGTSSITRSAMNEVWRIDRDQPVEPGSSMVDVVSRSSADTRFYSLVLGALATVAIVLAGIGIYGVLSYSVSERTHEIGVRTALGAGPRAVLSLVVRQSLTLALSGVLVGLAAAFGLTRLMSALLFGVAPTDPTTYLIVSILPVGVALLATLVPAWRALSVDSTIALRNE
jgi:putative ABC transport system permease protein